MVLVYYLYHKDIYNTKLLWQLFHSLKLRQIFQIQGKKNISQRLSKTLKKLSLKIIPYRALLQ